MEYDAIMIKAEDNVATALGDLAQSREYRVAAGDASLKIKMKEPIAFAHKFAVVDINNGEDIIKYEERSIEWALIFEGVSPTSSHQIDTPYDCSMDTYP